ncbi:MAG: hypothetical protein ACRD0N_09265 [Acidimicrobiales bacterium]
MPRWLVAALSAFVAAVLAAGVVGVVVNRDGDDSAAPSRRTSTTSTTATPSGASSTTAAPSTTAPPTGVEAVVPSLQAFVEKERGLAFRQPVKVTLLADGPFEARVRESDEEDLEELRDAEAVLEAMFLLDREVDLAEEVERFSAGAILGFYDTETKELVVRGREPTPYVRTILVHELTHALEDQHFDLDRADDLGDEAFLGFQALAEGSAGRVEDAYRASLSAADRRAAAREEAARATSVPDVPAVVQLIFGFPYAFGPDLVAAILRAGGQARLDAAFGDDSPASSEHVLHPSRYLRGDEPRAVPNPPADGTAFDDGEIGELFLSLMLGAGLDQDQADEAAEGWGGDHYVAWRDGDRTCVRMTFVMDTPADTAQLTEALADWAEERGNAAAADGTTLRTCG